MKKQTEGRLGIRLGFWKFVTIDKLIRHWFLTKWPLTWIFFTKRSRLPILQSVTQLSDTIFIQLSIDKYQVQKGRSKLLHWKFIFLFFRITLLTRKIQSATNQKLDWVKANWTFWNMIHPTKIQITLREAWTIQTFSELPIEYVGPHLQLN